MKDGNEVEDGEIPDREVQIINEGNQLAGDHSERRVYMCIDGYANRRQHPKARNVFSRLGSPYTKSLDTKEQRPGRKRHRSHDINQQDHGRGTKQRRIESPSTGGKIIQSHDLDRFNNRRTDRSSTDRIVKTRKPPKDGSRKNGENQQDRSPYRRSGRAYSPEREKRSRFRRQNSHDSRCIERATVEYEDLDMHNDEEYENSVNIGNTDFLDSDYEDVERYGESGGYGIEGEMNENGNKESSDKTRRDRHSRHRHYTKRRSNGKNERCNQSRSHRSQKRIHIPDTESVYNRTDSERTGQHCDDDFQRKPDWKAEHTYNTSGHCNYSPTEADWPQNGIEDVSSDEDALNNTTSDPDFRNSQYSSKIDGETKHADGPGHFPLTTVSTSDLSGLPIDVHDLLAAIVRIVLSFGDRAEVEQIMRKAKTELNVRFDSEKVLLTMLVERRDVFKCTEEWETALTAADTKDREEIFIGVKASIELCTEYSKASGKCNRDCNALHICKFYVLSGCSSQNCKFSHALFDDGNTEALKTGLLNYLEEDQIKTLLQKLENRNVTTLPAICRFYNTARTCKKGESCPHLHICQYFIKNQCKFERECMRSHDITQGQAYNVLQKLGLGGHDPSVLDVLWRNEETGGIRRISIPPQFSWHKQAVETELAVHKPAELLASKKDCASTTRMKTENNENGDVRNKFRETLLKLRKNLKKRTEEDLDRLSTLQEQIETNTGGTRNGLPEFIPLQEGQDIALDTPSGWCYNTHLSSDKEDNKDNAVEKEIDPLVLNKDTKLTVTSVENDDLETSSEEKENEIEIVPGQERKVIEVLQDNEAGKDMEPFTESESEDKEIKTIRDGTSEPGMKSSVYGNVEDSLSNNVENETQQETEKSKTELKVKTENGVENVTVTLRSAEDIVKKAERSHGERSPLRAIQNHTDQIFEKTEEQSPKMHESEKAICATGKDAQGYSLSTKYDTIMNRHSVIENEEEMKGAEISVEGLDCIKKTGDLIQTQGEETKDQRLDTGDERQSNNSARDLFKYMYNEEEKHVCSREETGVLCPTVSEERVTKWKARMETECEASDVDQGTEEILEEIYKNLPSPRFIVFKGKRIDLHVTSIYGLVTDVNGGGEKVEFTRILSECE